MSTPNPVPGTKVGAMYSIPLESLGPQRVEEEKKVLSVQARSSYGAPPPVFHAWAIQDGCLYVPRFYGMARFGAAEEDQRSDGERIAISFCGELTHLQTKALAAVCTRELSATGPGGVMINIYCGGGKTVLGARLAAHFGCKTAILVHKGIIRDQWKATFQRFCPGVKVGIVQGTKCEIDGFDVVIMMLMTIAKRDSLDMSGFGLVIADEAHHMAAPVTNLAMRKFTARRIVGMSATPERPDGLTRLLHWSLGMEGFCAKRTTETVRVSFALFPEKGREVLTRDGKPLVSVMISNLTANNARNSFLADRIAAMRRNGRVIIVLSDRISQLKTLHTMVVARGILGVSIGLLEGATPDSQRAVELSKPVVMCSYSMANEGVDKKEADTIVMASPKRRVVQCVGRVQRPCPTKKQPLVLDVIDDFSIFAALRWHRQKLYAKERYEMQVLPSSEKTGWFE